MQKQGLGTSWKLVGTFKVGMFLAQCYSYYQRPNSCCSTLTMGNVKLSRELKPNYAFHPSHPLSPSHLYLNGNSEFCCLIQKIAGHQLEGWEQK
jgi:hypothetical protein